MKNKMKQHIFLVDEPKTCKAVCRTLEQLGLKVSCFTRPDDCLEQLHSQMCDLLITEVKMPEIDGIELLTEAKRIVPGLRILVITGYGDIPMAVRAMKAGATVFMEKPLDRKAFLSTVESLLKQDMSAELILGKPLTETEIVVLRLILNGKTSKEIADLLHRAKRAIDYHRCRIYRKLGIFDKDELFKKLKKPREQHYRFTHHTLRDLFIKEPEVVIDRLRNDKGSAFLLKIWDKAGKDLGKFDLVIPGRLRHEVRMYDDSTTVAIISLPTPEAVSEAYFAALIYRPQKKQQKTITRFILLERSVPLGYSNLSSVLQEWTLDGIHKNIGYGCEPTLEAFYTAVCNLLGK